MSERVTLNPITTTRDTPQNVAAINDNFERIAEALDKTVTRSGEAPDYMEGPLDMNNNRVFNLPYPTTATEPVRAQDLQSFIALVETGATFKAMSYGNVSSNININVTPEEAIAFHSMTLTVPNTTISFTEPALLGGTLWSFVVKLKQGTGANLVTWPSNIKWQYGVAPVLPFDSGKEYIVTFVSNPDNPSMEWYGFSDGGVF